MTDRRRVLLLGHTGKLGRSLEGALPPSDEVHPANSRTLDAADFDQVRALLETTRPDIVFNAVAFLGIDPCERDPERALRLNALFPRLLAETACARGFTLVHFSTDAVFGDLAQGAYCESDAPSPVNVYGLTKFGGDCFVRDLAPRSYVLRIPLLFGPTDRTTQFVERMLARVRTGERSLSVADDIVFTPGYTPDIAAAAIALVAGSAPFGLYHLANSGVTSLHGLLSRILSGLGSEVVLERASHRDFPSLGKKNTRTPLVSEKLPPLRPWQNAVDEYCRTLKAGR